MLCATTGADVNDSSSVAAIAGIVGFRMVAGPVAGVKIAGALALYRRFGAACGRHIVSSTGAESSRRAFKFLARTVENAHVLVARRDALAVSHRGAIGKIPFSLRILTLKASVVCVFRLSETPNGHY
jgi:hypothetical protein